MQFIRKRNNVLLRKKELSEIKGWFKGRKKNELQEEIERSDKPNQEHERLSSEDCTESRL